MVQLDLSAFRPDNLLSKWWPVTAELFKILQSNENELDERLGEECSARLSDKSELLQKIKDESEQRQLTGKTLDGKITEEAAARQEADSALEAKTESGLSALGAELRELISTLEGNTDSALNTEAKLRRSGDDALRTSINTLQTLSHTHDNRDVIDGISGEDVRSWRENAARREDNSALHSYFDEMLRDISDRVNMLYAAAGITVYDGGMDGSIADGAALDGGEIGGSDEQTAVDFGLFGDSSALVLSAVYDGGTY